MDGSNVSLSTVLPVVVAIVVLEAGYRAIPPETAAVTAAAVPTATAACTPIEDPATVATIPVTAAVEAVVAAEPATAAVPAAF